VYPERTTDHGQATGKLYHLRLRVECTLFVIYKAGREPTPYVESDLKTPKIKKSNHRNWGNLVLVFGQVQIYGEAK
jgi:hypothetical protein